MTEDKTSNASSSAKRAWRIKRSAKRTRQANQNISYNENSDSGEEEEWNASQVPEVTVTEEPTESTSINEEPKVEKEGNITETAPAAALPPLATAPTTTTTSNVQKLKELLFKEKIAAFTCEIEAVHSGTHPELAQRLEYIDKRLERKLAVAEVKKEFYTNVATEQFLERVNAAQQDYEAAVRELKRTNLERLEKTMLKRRRPNFFVFKQQQQQHLEREYFLVLQRQLPQADVQKDLDMMINKATSH